VRRFPITLALLLDIFTTGQTVRAEIVSGIPRDAMIVRHHYDNETGLYFLTLQHDSFEPVKTGAVIPIHQITCKQIEPNADDYRRGYDAGYQAAIDFVATGDKPAALPSAADLDAVAAEESAKAATAGEAVPA